MQISKRLPLLILSVTLLSSACEKIETSSTSSIKWEPPLYPDIEFHINTPIQKVRLTPSPDGWNPNLKSTLSASTDKQSEFHYKLSCEYQGTDSKADYYSVTITYPTEGGSATIAETLQYRGKPTEIYREEDCLIGIRPGKESDKKTDPDQPLPISGAPTPTHPQKQD